MSFTTILAPREATPPTAEPYLFTKDNVILAPKSSPGISGFIFDIPDTETLQLQSDITDHFTESNSFLNDHIVRKPIMITLTGFIGELVYRTPEGILGAIQTLDNRLETVEAYAGDLTPGGVQIAQRVIGQAQNAISAINQTIGKVKNLVGLFDGEDAADTLQAKAYQQLFALSKMGEIVTVQTPWSYFDSMAIKNISFTQNAESKEMTDISITLKEIRFAEIKTVNFDQNQFPPAVEVQEAPEENQGQAGEETRDVGPLLLGFEEGKNFIDTILGPGTQ